jgi:hypothetical protein
MMRPPRIGFRKLLMTVLSLTVSTRALLCEAVPYGAPETTDFKAEFLKLCDVAADELNSDARQVPKPIPFYIDSYAVRALSVAFDMTGKLRYLGACKRWSDRMIEVQGRMVPKGAYYMNYGRKPGEKTGGWYVGDSSSIAMGILATSVRCSDPKEKERYLSSVKAYAELVIDNYIGEAGGVTDGLWPKYGGEWWCSSGVFGSLAFLLYDETGDEKYLQVGLDAVDWLNRLETRRIKFRFWEDGAPSVVMYTLEAYSAGLPHLKPGTQMRRAALVQITRMLDWMSKNQQGGGAGSPWDYNSQWGSKFGGLPFHMYVYSRGLPGGTSIGSAADQQLRHIAAILFKDGKPPLSQLACFTMMSYAERLSPGAIYRKSRH